jgi:hypothetical protein
MLQTYVVEKIKSHIFCSLIFFENRNIYEKMWNNIVELGWAQMIIWRMRGHKYTHSVNVIRTFLNSYVIRSLSVSVCVPPEIKLYDKNNVCTLLYHSALYVLSDYGSAWPNMCDELYLGFSPRYILYWCWSL